jgi:hypothetical protein
MSIRSQASACGYIAIGIIDWRSLTDLRLKQIGSRLIISIMGTSLSVRVFTPHTDGTFMQSQRSNKERLLEAADTAEKKAGRATEPSVKDTLFALGALYRDMAKQIEELEHIRMSLHQRQ